MKALTVVASLLAATAACAQPRVPPRANVPAPSTPAPRAATTEPAIASSGAFPEGDVANLVGEDRAWHARAREAVTKGDLYLAKRILLRLVAGYRRDKLLVAQHEWVQARLDAEAKPARDAMKAAPLGAVPAIPSSFRLARAARVPPRPTPKLALRKSTKNEVTDEARWFESAGPLSELALPAPETLVVFHIDVEDAATDRVLGRLTLGGWLEETPAPRLRREPFPPWIPPSFGSAGLARVLRSGTSTILTYGNRYLFVFDEERKLVRALDLFLFLYPESHVKRAGIKVGELTITTPEASTTTDVTVQDNGPRHDLQWAEVQDGVLYLSTSYNGYAKEVKGQTAYVTALDLATGDVLFRSAPLTSNSRNFVLVGGAIVTGYGFTGEPDFVFSLDAATGKTIQKIAAPSSPEYLAWSESKRELAVRTYDHDLLFAVE